MKKTLEQNTGLSLLVLVFLLMTTMVLHPVGGDIEHLVRQSKWIVFSHAISLLALPFGAFGFWGLTKFLGREHPLAILGFSSFVFCLVAVMLAATANGITLPLFLQHYINADASHIEKITPVLQLNFSINKAFDYIYTGFFCMSVLCWSFEIVTTRIMKVWVGWAGIVISLGVITLVLMGLSVDSLQGLRLSMSGFLVWTTIIGIQMTRLTRSIS